MKNRRFLIAILALISMVTLPTDGQRRFSMLTYNCENAFDTIDSPHHNDEEFLPDGSRHWTRWRYNRKLKHIAQVVLAANTDNPVDIVCLQEVEGDSVCHHLTHNTMLSRIGYKYLCSNKADRRGVGVTFLYYPMTFQLLSHDAIFLKKDVEEENDTVAVREILHVTGLVHNCDTIDVYCVHLPSQLGGSTGYSNRVSLLNILSQHIDSVASIRQNPNIIIAGDCNTTPSSSEMKQLLKQTRHPLRNMMSHRKGGSYKYQGAWSWLDQIIVSQSMLSNKNNLHVKESSVGELKLSVLMEADETWGGQKPFRTFRGPSYIGGYSDHLPVVMNLIHKCQKP